MVEKNKRYFIVLNRLKATGDYTRRRWWLSPYAIADLFCLRLMINEARDWQDSFDHKTNEIDYIQW